MKNMIVTATEIQAFPLTQFIPIAISVLAIVAFAIYVYLNMRHQEKASRVAREVQRITNSIGAGIVEYIPYDDGFIIYGSRGFYAMLGYTKEEIRGKYKNHFFEMILPEYRSLAGNLEIEGKEKYIKQEICIQTKDGLKWFLLTGNLVTRKNGVVSVSAVLVDITKDREINERLRMEQERYRLATELSDDVIFNYRIDDDVVFFSENFENSFWGSRCIENFSSNMEAWKELVYEADLPLLEKLRAENGSIGDEIDIQLRLRSKKGKYIWCHIVAGTIRDTGGNGKEMVGKIINIDQHMQELSILEKKSMRDSMTGAYNKISTSQMVESYISRYLNIPGVFMLLDVDKFKEINDTYGHLMGDNVLIYVVDQIMSVFRTDDIVGRIGGDEFVVFAGNIRNHDDMIGQARKLQDALRIPAQFDDILIPISVSIGVALYPEHGSTYGELAHCADKALYQVKGTTRDSFAIYGDNPSI